MNLPFLPTFHFPRRLGAVVGAALLAASAHAQFIPGFALHSFPDINSSLLTVNYQAGSDTLTVTGGAAATIRFVPADPPPPPTAPQYNLTGASFSLTANVGATAGGAAIFNSGTITIIGGLAAGTMAGDPSTPTPYSFAPGTVLIQGNLTAFGYDNDATGGFTRTFQFLFTRTGGALDALFPGNDPGRIVLSGWGTGSGTYAGNFNNNFGGTLGVADTTIPEPSQFVGVFGVLLGAIVLRRRMQSHA